MSVAPQSHVSRRVCTYSVRIAIAQAFFFFLSVNLQAVQENWSHHFIVAPHIWSRVVAHSFIHLAVNNYVCFPKSNPFLREWRLASIKDIQKSSLQTVQAVPKKGFQKCFEHWRHFCNKWVVSYEKNSSTLGWKVCLRRKSQAPYLRLCMLDSVRLMFVVGDGFHALWCLQCI